MSDIEIHALIRRLCEGDEPPWLYPMTPEKASALIVSALLSDLPEDRKKAVQEVIEEWASEWSSAVSATDAESGPR